MVPLFLFVRNGVIKMGRIVYKKNVLKELKKKGYTTTRLQKERILSEGAIQSLREGRVLSIKNITKLCYLLECDVGDILMYVDDHDHDIEMDSYLS